MILLALVGDKDRPARTISRAKIGACVTGILVVGGVWLLLSGRNLTDPNIVEQIAGAGLMVLTAMLGVFASFCTIVATTVLEAQRHERELDHFTTLAQDYEQHIEELEKDLASVRAAKDDEDDDTNAETQTGAAAPRPPASPAEEIRMEPPPKVTIVGRNGLIPTTLLLVICFLGLAAPETRGETPHPTSKITAEAPARASAPVSLRSLQPVFVREGACEVAVDVSGSVPREALREAIARLAEQLGEIVSVFGCSLLRIVPFSGDLFTSIKEIALTAVEANPAAGCLNIPVSNTPATTNKEALKRAFPGIDWNKPHMEACVKNREKARDAALAQRNAQISQAAEILRGLTSLPPRGSCTPSLAADRARLRSGVVIVLSDGLLFGCPPARRSRPTDLPGRMFFLLLMPPDDGRPDRADRLLGRLTTVQDHFPDAVAVFATEATMSFWQGLRGRK
jgi:hypothetical protein